MSSTGMAHWLLRRLLELGVLRDCARSVRRSSSGGPPLAKPLPAKAARANQIGRRDRLGGLLHERYALAA